MPRLPQNSDPFEDLDSDFKDRIAAMSTQAIKLEMAKVAVNEELNQRTRAADVDLAEKQKLVKELSAPYAETSKVNRSRMNARTMRLAESDNVNDQEELAKIILEEQENQETKANDQDLEAAKESAKYAAAGYTEASKMNSLRLKYCKRVLSDKGGA